MLRSNPKGVPWQEFQERAEKAAKRVSPRKGTVETLQARIMQHPPPEERRCEAVTKRLGRRCKSWAVKGASRCIVHGGLLEVPDHPAAGRLWRKGKVTDEDREKQANKWLRQSPEGEKYGALVRGIIRERGLRAKPARVKEGVLAWSIEDGGRAWRRFLASLDREA